MRGPIKVHISHHVQALRIRSAERWQIKPGDCHVGHLVLQGMFDRPDELNQIDGATDTSETNISVANRSCKLASALNNYGLKPGDTLVIIGNNHLDLTIPYLASHYNGLTLCCIDPTVIAGDLATLFSYINPKIIFCPSQLTEMVDGALLKNNLDGHIVTFDSGDNDMNHFIERHNGTELGFKPALIDQYKTIAWFMLTSGTTGLPKVAMIPYQTLITGLQSWWSQFTDRIYVNMAMATIQWMSSLIFFISGPLMYYTRLQSSVSITPPLLVGMINKYKPNVTAWTPHLLGQFLEAAGNMCDLSSFRYIAIGGSAIEKPLLDKFKEKCNAYLYLVYGMTELLVPAFNFNEDTPFGSTGQPYDKFEYKLVGENGDLITEPNQTGELWLRGDEFFTGYYNNPEETKAVITQDGWVKTGDIFYRDPDNFYYFVERKRLLIKCQGMFISPLQLEGIIKEHPNVADVCVVGIPDSKVMELPVAAIVKKNGGELEPVDVFNLVKKALPQHKQLHGGVFFLDSLPTTPSGKIHRAKIRDMAFGAQRTLPPASP